MHLCVCVYALFNQLAYHIKNYHRYKWLSCGQPFVIFLVSFYSTLLIRFL